MKKLFIISLILCVCAGKHASAQIPTWNIGYPNSTDVTATLNNGTLTISGSGNMQDWGGSNGNTPWYSFYLSDIESVLINSGVSNIGNDAFLSCSNLASITIPNSVTTIGDDAFFGCSGLTSVTIPNSVTMIGIGAFSHCSGLTSVTIPNSITTIVAFLFYDCSNLTSVTIPNSVTTIEGGAFESCSSLTDIDVDASNPNYSSLDGVLFNKSQDTLICCPAGKTGSYSIPNSVTTIGQHAFSDCTGLISVTIPNSVTTIVKSAFLYCSGLTSVTIGNSVMMIGSSAFSDCTGLTSIYVKALTPPWLGSSVFNNVKDTIPVHVPCGKASDYQGWGGFTNIVDDVAPEDLTVNSNDITMGTATITKHNTCTDNEAQITATPSHWRYHFVRWHDGNTDNPRTITVTQDTVFTAIFELDPSGIVRALRATPLQVYPNPTNNNITISLPDPTTNAVFTIYDLQGRMLLNRNINNGETVSVDGFSAGMYVYSVVVDGKVQHGKLSIIR